MLPLTRDQAKGSPTVWLALPQYPPWKRPLRKEYGVNLKSSVYLVLATVLVIGLVPTYAKPGYLPNGHLDMAQLATRYKDGDFEQLQDVLEAYVKQTKRADTNSKNDEEWVFAYKYLGVTYASDSASTSKAETYFHKLFSLAPNTEILDLYVSNRIQLVFDRVKREYQQRQAIQPKKRIATLPMPQKDSKIRESSHGWIYWSLGAVALSTGAAFYLLTPSENKIVERVSASPPAK
jgi:hypothetical protein